MNRTGTRECDVAVVGAGPAGLFAAKALSENGVRVAIIDSGKVVNDRKCPMKTSGICAECEHCDIMGGVGGAGIFSDGTLNLRPDVGGDLSEYLDGDMLKAAELVDRVDQLFVEHGAPGKEFSCTGEKVDQLKRSAAAAGARFVAIRQRHLGSDQAPEVIGRFADELKRAGVEFILESEVEDLVIEGDKCKGVRLQDGSTVDARAVIIAPGRVGTGWVNTLVEKHGLRATHNPVDLGVRVEVPAIIMEPVTELSHDPKFHIFPPTYDDFVRTFCTNRGGYVVKENYQGHIGVNGHSLISERSENTNFAMLVQVKLTEPVENTTDYGRSIAELATTIGGGRPTVQRLGDLRSGRRSTSSKMARNLTSPTLKDCTPGDISMALPHRLVTDIVESLDILDRIIPGVAAGNTLLYGPEVKFYTMRLDVDGNMMTNLRGLFAAGDGAGLSRDIVNAAATGLLAGEGVGRVV